MQSKITLALIFCFSIMLAACGGTETQTNKTNTNTANVNSEPANTNTGLETTKKVETGPTNDAPTLGPAVNAYYDALRRKDAAGVKKLMGQEFLTTTEKQMKEEGKTDIVAFLTEFDKVPEQKMEARNEQINGNEGSVEVKGGSYVGWSKLIFVNEGGVWKITNRDK
jgi:hypothetical protein